MNIIKLLIAFLLGAISSYLLVVNLNDGIDKNNPAQSNATLAQGRGNTEQLQVLTHQSNEEKQPTDKKELGQDIEKVSSFLNEFESIEVQTYSGLVSEVSGETAEQYENLNQDLFNAFTFTNQEELRLLLANGFPYPQELEYVYSQSLDELISVIDERRAKYNVNDPEYNQTVKLGVLAFNRAMDDFVDVLRRYRPDYQVGDPLPEMQQLLKGGLPADLENATNRMMVLQGKAAGNIASSYLAAARFNQINLYSAELDYLKHERLTNLAMADIILQSRRVQESMWPNTRDMPPEFISIQTALLNIKLPCGSCNPNPN